MRLISLIIFCGFLVACASSDGGRTSDHPAPLPLNTDDQAYVDQMEADGRLMYETDLRAAQASDMLLGKIDIADHPNSIGWITYPNTEDFTVSFYEKIGEDFGVLADVVYGHNKTPQISLNPKRTPSDMEKSMVKARLAALQKVTNSCSDRFNTVVIPSTNQDTWDVYVIAATTNPKLIQVGGHVKVTVSKTTAEIIDVLPLSKSCLALDKSGENLPEGTTLSALTMSHLVTPMPVAIHPYLNLLHNITLFVVSQRGLWMLKSGEMSLLRATKE
jgi:hypothetical protein